MNKEDKKIDSIKLWEEQEKAEKADPDLKYDSLNDRHTAIIKRLRHFGKYHSHEYSKAERRKLIKMIQEKDYTALFTKYFETQIGMIFYGERLFDLCFDAVHEIVHVQTEIMCSIPIEFRKELFDRLKENVDKNIKWWLKGSLKMWEGIRVRDRVGALRKMNRQLSRIKDNPEG